MGDRSPVAAAPLTNNNDKNSTKLKEEWKRNVWRSKTASRLIASDNRMAMLKSKEKVNPSTFSVHQALLSFYSPYHDTLLNEPFLEGMNSPTEPFLVEAGSDVLKLSVTWLYNGRVNMRHPKYLSNIEVADWYLGATKLYIPADSYNCVALARLVVSNYLNYEDDLYTFPTWGCIGLLSGSSLESSSLYRYYLAVLDTHWCGGLRGDEHEGQFQGDPNGEDPLPSNLAYRLLLRKLHRTKDGQEGDCRCCHERCEFHRHESEQERKATCGSLDDETEDDGDAISNFDSEVDSESESESDTYTASEAFYASEADTALEPWTASEANASMRRTGVSCIGGARFESDGKGGLKFVNEDPLFVNSDDSDSDSDSSTGALSDADTSAEPTTKKRVREEEDKAGAKTKRVKAV
ncbi:hypothetical protein D6D01_09273 [Aureobasidium pullulans]|uniref:BTB domain-containing protein n=1 Tax=Aureobasidium pullulans TaxID=5580 RepID=A0A4S9K5X4_AURPU|nr:hypothetical protein D6D01_09273 [Aureobasidium pullulans]